MQKFLSGEVNELEYEENNIWFSARLMETHGAFVYFIQAFPLNPDGTKEYRKHMYANGMYAILDANKDGFIGSDNDLAVRKDVYERFLLQVEDGVANDKQVHEPIHEGAMERKSIANNEENTNMLP